MHRLPLLGAPQGQQPDVEQLTACAGWQVIAQHLFHTGRFRVGELFVQEAGVAGGEALKEPFTELHEILMQVRARAPRLATAALAETLALSGRATSFPALPVTLSGLQSVQPASCSSHHIRTAGSACMLSCDSAMIALSGCMNLLGVTLQLLGCGCRTGHGLGHTRQCRPD